MKPIKHKVTHYYQPTNNTCGYAALATYLSHFGIETTPAALVGKVPQPEGSEEASHGSVTAQLVEWCQSQNLQTHMYTSDCLVLDLSWKNMEEKKIKERLEAVRATRNIPAIGEHWTKVFIDTYISMIESGSKLDVLPFITTDLLYKLLNKGPVFANICSTASTGLGRTKSPRLRKNVLDDVDGKVSTHSVVIYGHDKDGKFLVADPWDGIVSTEPEQMVLAIEAAQIECENQCFVIER